MGFYGRFCGIPAPPVCLSHLLPLTASPGCPPLPPPLPSTPIHLTHSSHSLPLASLCPSPGRLLCLAAGSRLLTVMVLQVVLLTLRIRQTDGWFTQRREKAGVKEM